MSSNLPGNLTFNIIACRIANFLIELAVFIKVYLSSKFENFETQHSIFRHAEKLFSGLDRASGYWQVEHCEEKKEGSVYRTVRTLAVPYDAIVVLQQPLNY